MDADGASDERGKRGRAKSYGPGLPTLRLRPRDHLADDGGKKVLSPGSTKETVKTIAQRMPG
jgi:hypothetical protein